MIFQILCPLHFTVPSISVQTFDIFSDFNYYHADRQKLYIYFNLYFSDDNEIVGYFMFH